MTRRLGWGLLALWIAGCGDGGTGNDGGGGGAGGGGGDVSAVSRIELKPELVLLEPGQTVDLVPTALDAEGRIVGNIPFTFTSSDSAVVRIDDGVATAVAVGSAFLSASANGVTSDFLVVAVQADTSRGSSSEALIASGLASGAIDDEQALVYRVYAAFKDPRLPFEYQGDPAPTPDTEALDDAKARWDTLSLTAKEVLAPFFVPPAYLGSWTSVGRQPARALIEICNENPQVNPNFASIPPLGGGRVKVWYDTRVARGRAQAQLVYDALEMVIWDKVASGSGLGLKTPLSDASTRCNGGDGRLDVFLVDMAVDGQVSTDDGETFPDIRVIHHAPVFLLLNRNLPNDKLLGAATHEFCHAAQWAQDLAAGDMKKYPWLKDAICQEAVDFVYPLLNTEHVFVRDYLDTPGEPINAGAPANRPYAGYLPFQMLARQGNPGVVGAVWAAAGTDADELKAFDHGLPGGLQEQWPKFARLLWNDDPVAMQPASFASWDTMAELPNFPSATGDLGGASEHELTFPTSVKNAAVRFFEVDFTEPQVRSMLFHNTFYELKKAGKPISVQVLWQTEDNVWSEEDWSALEWIGFCRDQKDQRVKRLIVIFASAQTEGAPLEAGEAPGLTRTNLPCWGFEGMAQRVTQDSSWDSGRSTHTVTGRWGFQPVTQLFDAATGRLRVQLHGPLFKSGQALFDEDYTQGTCRYRASGSWPMETSIVVGGTVSSSLEMNYFNQSLPDDLRSEQESLLGAAKRAYLLTGVNSRLVQGTVSGPAPCPGDYATGPQTFVLTSSGGVAKVANADGTLSGSFVDGDSTYTWSFTALREP